MVMLNMMNIYMINLFANNQFSYIYWSIESNKNISQVLVEKRFFFLCFYSNRSQHLLRTNVFNATHFKIDNNHKNK